MGAFGVILFDPDMIFRQYHQMTIINIHAPAKINLSLSIIGRLKNGYHLLSSPVVFADIGDALQMDFTNSHLGPYIGADIDRPDDMPSRVELTLDGQFAEQLRDVPLADNLVTRAISGFLSEFRCELGEGLHGKINVRLVKNLPAQGGIGGGSSDAAAAIAGVMRYLNIRPADLGGIDGARLQGFLLGLGGDVPICFRAQYGQYAGYMSGLGEGFVPMKGGLSAALSGHGIILIHPGQHYGVSTQKAYDIWDNTKWDGQYADANYDRSVSDMPENMADFWRYIDGQGNDFLSLASRQVPVISGLIDDLRGRDGLCCANMSGSGSTVFGVFQTPVIARQVADILRQKYLDDGHDYWVADGRLL